MGAPRILVVEDEGIVALHLCQQLTSLGYDVPNTVSRGDVALRAMNESPPDLVLMDIHLDGALDGIATAALIPPAARIPVIYLTAYSEDATLARAKATNPYGYLLKPFGTRELHATIQMALARCRSERAAYEAQKARWAAEKLTAMGELAAGVAGHFDEMLRFIYGQLDRVGQQTAGVPALAGAVDDALREAIEKERLLRRLLEFSGRRELYPRPARLGDLVTTVIARVRPMLGPAMRIATRLPPELWSVRIDHGQFAKALTCLLSNARDAMPWGGDLTIDARNTELDARSDPAGQGGPHVLLSVADTGEGMRDHVLERAFEPFFTTKPGADGLGLSLVFGFLRRSGGHMGVDSVQGQGTTVRLWLPAVSGDGAAVSPASADYAAPALQWQEGDGTLFASMISGGTRISRRLLVEALPKRNGWDWTVWCPGASRELARHGRATSVATAIAAAEAAARSMDED